jgi:Leucine-rich repeat (LRR) protein
MFLRQIFTSCWVILHLQDLHTNPLSSLPPTIGRLTKVKHLSLQCCQLTSLPEELGECTGLIWLALNVNKLT